MFGKEGNVWVCVWGGGGGVVAGGGVGGGSVGGCGWGRSFCPRYSIRPSRSDSNMESSNSTKNPNCFAIYSSASEVFSDLH